jgi:hypothetical protein
LLAEVDGLAVVVTPPSVDVLEYVQQPFEMLPLDDVFALITAHEGNGGFDPFMGGDFSLVFVEFFGVPGV